MTHSPIEAWIEAFPQRAEIPFQLQPRRLYSVSDLYDAFDAAIPATWTETYDQRAWRWFTDAQTGRPRELSISEAIAARIHDAAIEQQITAHLRELPYKVVGVMGGHDALRDDPAYLEVARLARALRRRGLQIVTGGGPGLMEAANFGAFMAPYENERLGQAHEALCQSPSYEADPGAWLAAACAVRTDLLAGEWRREPKLESRNLGIPTWHYGKEPPNLFATHVGKYFYNSVREDGLVSVATGGLVFAPGAAGTVQEVFQNLNLNYYLRPGETPTPMVFVGRDFWDPARFDPKARPRGAHSKPVYPLVEKLARDGGFIDALLLSDDADEVLAFLEAADLQGAGRTQADMRLSQG
jgi:predicted Rossmann-fold nucleotide-binding protein